MTKSRNSKTGDTKLGLRIGDTGNVYFSRCYGGVDMLVSGPGGLLALATEGGGTRLPDRVDIDRLRSSGAAMMVEQVVPRGGITEGPIRRVDVITMRHAPSTPDYTEHMTPVPSILSPDGRERHGPPSPQEYADHIASTLAFEAATNASLSASSAYEYYREALAELNEQHRTGRVGRMPASQFDRLVAVADFLMESGDEPPVGATIH